MWQCSLFTLLIMLKMYNIIHIKPKKTVCFSQFSSEKNTRKITNKNIAALHKKLPQQSLKSAAKSWRYWINQTGYGATGRLASQRLADWQVFWRRRCDITARSKPQPPRNQSKSSLNNVWHRGDYVASSSLMLRPKTRSPLNTLLLPQKPPHLTWKEKHLFIYFFRKMLGYFTLDGRS